MDSGCIDVNKKQSKSSGQLQGRKGNGKSQKSSTKVNPLVENSVPMIRLQRRTIGTTAGVSVIKRAYPLKLYINGTGIAASNGFYYDSLNYGNGIGFQLLGAGSVQMFNSSATTGPSFNFPDMSTYAGLYDEFRIKSFTLDCMMSTNSVAPSGTVDGNQLIAAPIFQVVSDPNDGNAPSAVTSLLSYNECEIWHASTGNSRRAFTIVPKVGPLAATGLTVPGMELGHQWISALQYSTCIHGFIKMYYDFEAFSTGGCQGVLTIYPIIEVEWRTQF